MKVLRLTGAVLKTAGARLTGAVLITRLAGALGAEITGINLAEASAAEIKTLEALLAEHLVLFFPI